jgi:hypothetical protein
VINEGFHRTPWSSLRTSSCRPLTYGFSTLKIFPLWIICKASQLYNDFGVLSCSWMEATFIFYTEMKCNTRSFSQIVSFYFSGHAILLYGPPLCIPTPSPRCLCRTASDRYCNIIIYRCNVRLIQIAMVLIGRCMSMGQIRCMQAAACVVGRLDRWVGPSWCKMAARLHPGPAC